MKIYSNGPDAVSDLHKKGFTNDFQLSGNDLLWVQENVNIRVGEFAILEYHKITDIKRNMNELVIFGIIATHHNIKGILVKRYKRDTIFTPPILVKKLKMLSVLAGFSFPGRLI